MWIFSRQGFVSIVRHISEPDTFLVRARVAADLEAVLSAGGVKAQCVESADADYRFRAFITRSQFNRVMAALADSVDYANFKSAVATDGAADARLAAYHKVWHVMQTLQQ
jgi:hypothetical protein